MISKSVAASRDLLADVAVNAVSAVAEKERGGQDGVDDDNIQVVKKQGGSMDDTQMISGIIVDKEAVHPAMPKARSKLPFFDVFVTVRSCWPKHKVADIDRTKIVIDAIRMHFFIVCSSFVLNFIYFTQ